jgi:hypothetical protein
LKQMATNEELTVSAKCLVWIKTPVTARLRSVT